MRWCSFDEAEGGQSVEAFFHGEVAGAPAGSQLWDALIREHDNERMGPRAGCKAYEDGTHCEGCRLAGTQRLLDRGPSFVAGVDHLCGGWCGRQVGCEHRAAVAFGDFGRRVRKDRERYGTLRYGQRDPVSDTQC